VGAHEHIVANATYDYHQEPRGTVAFVLHSHLPWVLGHGGWPVGEEWLYQAYAHSYLPLFDALAHLGARGFRNIASLGITPILAAQLDDPRTVTGLESWLHNWQLRAGSLPNNHPVRDYELGRAQSALAIFRGHYSRGTAPRIRSLIDDQVVQFLGGPATHPFTPGLDERIHEIAIRAGLEDSARRYGTSPIGIWVPECAYRPGQEGVYQQLGITHFMVDEPAVVAVGKNAGVPYRLGESMVKVVARNAQISDLLWSHERGYAGAAPYRDFHAVDHAYGLKLSAVGEKSQQDKPVYDPQSAQIQIEVDAQNFVRELRTSFDVQREQGTESPTVVIGVDAELLGHWWHEGVAWFERVIELLPESKISTSTLEQVTSTARTSIQLSASSWGSGKDWSVWTGNPVRDIAMMNSQSQEYVLDLIDRNTCTAAHLNQLMLQLSSDWAFMITRETAAQYARDRVLAHMSQLESGVDPDAPFPLISFSASRVRTRTDSA